MVTKKTSFLFVLVLMAAGMLGVLLILAASAAPAAPIPTNQIYVSPTYLTQAQAQDMLESQSTRAAVVADTKSMEPVLVTGNQVLERVPKSASEIKVGDIITYGSELRKLTIIHRVISINTDDYGWFATTKGDNAPTQDNEKIRFSMVKGIVVAIIM